jgi:hypothetical protein
MKRVSLRLPIVGLFLIATAGGACSSANTTTPTSTAATTYTETFSALLSPAGALIFPFQTNTAGTVTASLTTISPDTGLTLGISLGVWDGTTCAIVIDDPTAAQAATLTGAVAAAGALCVRVYDSGGVLTQNESILVTVTHP